MAKPSDFSATLMADLVKAMAPLGWEPEDIDRLIKDKANLSKLRDVVWHEATITYPEPHIKLLRTLDIPTIPEVRVTHNTFKELPIVGLTESLKKRIVGVVSPESSDTSLSLVVCTDWTLERSLMNKFGDKAELTVAQFVEVLRKYGDNQLPWFMCLSRDIRGQLCCLHAQWFTGDQVWGLHLFEAPNRDHHGTGEVFLVRS